MFASRTNWRLDQNRFTQALEEHRRSGKELLDLTVSNPTACGLAYPEREIVAALGDQRALVYSPESKGSARRERPSQITTSDVWGLPDRQTALIQNVFCSHQEPVKGIATFFDCCVK